MPNYEYQCTTCNHKFELWQTVGAAAPVCSECGAEVKKIFHVPRVIFKGSGFYVTDLRAEKEGKSNSDKNGDKAADKAAETSSASSGASAGESKTETSKTETKSEATPAAASAPTTSSAASSSSDNK